MVDEDCPPATICNLADPDLVEDNNCVCDQPACNLLAAENPGAGFDCRSGGNDFAFTSICSADCNNADVGDYTGGICPEGYICLYSNRANRDARTSGRDECFPLGIQCKSGGVFLDRCPQFMGCVDDSELFQASDACAPLCDLSDVGCSEFPCPEGFEGVITND
jgi:hypothetical protein